MLGEGQREVTSVDGMKVSGEGGGEKGEGGKQGEKGIQARRRKKGG